MLSFDQLLSEGVGMLFGKEKKFERVRFSPSVFEAMIVKFEAVLRERNGKIRKIDCTYQDRDGDTKVTNPSAHHLKLCLSSNAFYGNCLSDGDECITFRYSYSDLEMGFYSFNSLSHAEELLGLFNAQHKESKLPVEQTLKSIEVFIGHGRSQLWRDLRDHLQDHHNVKVKAYETGIRAGYTIIEVLQELQRNTSLALLVHTGEDETKDGEVLSRQNVVHETGLFQGKLGFKRAIVLLEQDTTEFSNIAGLQQIRFAKGRIKETFGDVLAILRREFA